MGIVKSCYVERAKSKTKDIDYTCLVFDVGWKKVRLFLKNEDIQALTGKTLQEVYSLKVGDIIPITFEK